MKRNNKGFSLVELLVSFAILGIVSTIIGVIMTSGSNMFSRNKKILDLQYKSQIASAQLNNMIQNCDGGIAIAENGDIYIATITAPYEKDVTGSTGSAVIYALSRGSLSGEDPNTIYLREINVAATSDGADGIAITPGSITLSNYTAQPFCSKVRSIDSTVGTAAAGHAKYINISLELAEGSTSYTKNISESFRSRPIYLTQVNVAAGSNLLDTLKTKIWG